jgi:hypothetical protein
MPPTVRLEPDTSSKPKEASPAESWSSRTSADGLEALVVTLRLLGCEVRVGATGRPARPRLGRHRAAGHRGYGQDTDRRRSAEAGFDAHLVKPIGSEDVLRPTGVS